MPIAILRRQTKRFPIRAAHQSPDKPRLSPPARLNAVDWTHPARAASMFRYRNPQWPAPRAPRRSISPAKQSASPCAFEARNRKSEPGQQRHFQMKSGVAPISFPIGNCHKAPVIRRIVSPRMRPRPEDTVQLPADCDAISNPSRRKSTKIIVPANSAMPAKCAASIAGNAQEFLSGTVHKA